jgi:hypothetical protein
MSASEIWFRTCCDGGGDASEESKGKHQTPRLARTSLALEAQATNLLKKVPAPHPHRANALSPLLQARQFASNNQRNPQLPLKMAEPTPNPAVANPDIDPALTNGLAQQAQQAPTEQPADVEMADSGSAPTVSIFPNPVPPHSSFQNPTNTTRSNQPSTLNPKPNQNQPRTNPPSRPSRLHPPPRRPHRPPRPRSLQPARLQRRHPPPQPHRATHRTRLRKRPRSLFRMGVRRGCI